MSSNNEFSGLQMAQLNDTDILMPFVDMIQQLADLTDRLEDPHTGQTLEIQQVTVNLPIELNVSVNDEGSVTLFGSAPTQTVETTILPVFHRMNLTIFATDGQ